jgi:hypothetical protein
MKRDNIFWGSALVLLGLLFFLQTQGIIPSIFPYLWPLALILFGGWMILGVYWKPNPSDEEHFQISLQNAKSVRYRFSHGAGSIEIKSGAPMGQALSGSSSAGMDYSSRLDGDKLNVKVDAGASFIPFVGPANGKWVFLLAKDIPASVKVETGASHLDMDLSDVQAQRIELETGASNSNIIMPANGASILDLEAGAASVNITIPQGVAGRIRVKEGLTALNVDTARFPQLDSRLYQSSDFDTAANRAEVNVEAGLGSITIK